MTAHSICGRSSLCDFTGAVILIPVMILGTIAIFIEISTLGFKKAFQKRTLFSAISVYVIMIGGMGLVFALFIETSKFLAFVASIGWLYFFSKKIK
ncbi:hypothetical protein ACIPUP_00875 [Pectobacterium actinidiae]|uniref:Uncharacterized protein n=2 Tax=Pectobacterium TaxID=122277 RepID=A0ABW8G4X8_9GAMM|nr:MULTISPECIES: hypothetical protein [Pectobacterium]